VSDLTDGKAIPSDRKKKESMYIAGLEDKMEMLDNMDDDFEIHHPNSIGHIDNNFDESEIIEEPLSLQEKEIDMIRKALQRHNGKRKNAAKELGISERTLYRKIKEFNIE
jgi:transcriptional regulator with PAS, ATPase and Fis domain